MAQKRSVKAPRLNTVPEGSGVAATAIKEDDIRMMVDEKQPRKPGNWVKVSPEELAKYEAAGKLVGWDPENGEALLKE